MEPNKPDRPVNRPGRKPLRRAAAWSLLLGGLAGTALMLGLGAYVISSAPSAGPGEVAIWPAGTEIAVAQSLGPQRNRGGVPSVDCTVIPQGGQATAIWLRWDQPKRPDFTGSATITCSRPVKVLTGPSLIASTITRGPLIIVPLLAVGFGLMSFYPGFTALADSLSPGARLIGHLTTRIAVGRDWANRHWKL